MPKEFQFISKRRKNQLIKLELASLVNMCENSINNIQHVSSEIDNHNGISNQSKCLYNKSVVKTKLYSESASNSCVNNTLDSDSCDTSIEHDHIVSASNLESFDDMSIAQCIDETDTILPINLESDLRKWVVQNNIPHNAVNNLLQILWKHGHNTLCSDVRTLMKTPRNISSEIISKNGGHYVHFGFITGLESSIKKYLCAVPESIKVNLNIDGLPLSKSSGSQFWPILASLEIGIYTEPFVIGIHHGKQKPKSVNEFLQPLVEELLLVLNNGIYVLDKKYSVKINAIVCDAPAKSYILCIKGHTGHFGCTKCIQEGDYIENRVTFPESNSVLRTDESLKLKSQPEHHTGISVLETLDIGLVSSVPLDYMHLVCLGVVKRLLTFWIKGKKSIRLNAQKLEEFSMAFIAMTPFITKEFARKPRSIFDIDRWKATEFRQFLLYTGPVVLQSVLPRDLYYHFLALSISIRILADQEMCLTFNEYAENLLLWFVSQYPLLYGAQYITHNVHNLIHLAADVKNFGPLENFSAFKFENHMQKLKKKLKGSKPLHEITNRKFEEDQVPQKRYTAKHYPLIHYSKDEVSYLEFNGFHVSTKKIDNCCIMNDNSVVNITGMTEENSILYIKGRVHSCTPFFTEPCDSRSIGLAVLSNVSSVNSVKLLASNIKKKCVKLYSRHNNADIVIPLLHCDNQTIINY